MTQNYVTPHPTKQGQRVYVTEVVADSFQLLESRESRNNSNTSTQNSFGQPEEQNYQNSFGQTSPMDIPDDDLPF